MIPPISRTVSVDFETFWSTDFTLSKLSTSEYVRDARFFVHCAAISVGGKKPKVVWGHDKVGIALKKIDWTTHALLAQNTAFDGFIMAHCYGIVPCFYFDTKSMAAGLLNGVLKSNSLKNLAPLYGVGRKDDTSLQSTKGCLTIPKEWRESFATYNAADCQQCWDIHLQQRVVFPPRELEVIDLVVRMFCDSKLYVNEELAREGLASEMIERHSEILKSGAEESELVSNDKFAKLLSKYIDPPTKISPATGAITWAFSQTDEEFTALQDSEDVRVALLVRGRLAAKSSQAETRAYRLIEAGKNSQPLPVGYTYSAALTHRFGGTNKLNLQNLPRVDKKKPKPSDALRRSIIAPPKHSVIVADSAQIEARTLAWLAEQEDVLMLFAANQDVYSHDASAVFGKSVESITSDERFIGKIIRLGLGYGMGHKKYQTTLALGTMGPPVQLELAECKRHVDTYRKRNNMIVKCWKEADNVLRHMMERHSGTAFRGIISYTPSTITLPNGMPMHYPQLAMDENGDITYNTHRGRRKIYGGKLIENLVQALARIIVVEQMLDISEMLKLAVLKPKEFARVSMMTHDEVVVIGPTRIAKPLLGMMLHYMKRGPDWAAGLPLSAEGNFDSCYSK